MSLPHRFRRRPTAPLLLAALLALILPACFQQPAPNAPLFEITTARATSATSFELTFSHPLGDGANDPDNYLVRDPDGVPLPVVGAYLGTPPTRVTLTTQPQQSVPYTVTVRGVARAADGRVEDETPTFGPVPGSDLPAPAVDSAIALSNTRLLVVFGDPASDGRASMSDSALDTDAYALVPSGNGKAVDVTAVEFSDGGDDRSRVVLTTTSLQGRDYRLVVTGVRADPDARPLDPFRREASFTGIAANDETPPTVTQAYATSNTSLVVVFSEPVSDNATDPSRYTVADAAGAELTVSNAVPDSYSTRVTLTTTPMANGELYTVTVAGIRDRNGNRIGADASTEFTGAPAGAPGPDTTPPRVTGAASSASTRVVVAFSEVVRGGADSAENPDHYSIVGSATLGNDLESQAILTVTDAVLSENGRSVVLTTLTQSEIAYTLSVSNVVDLAGNSVIGPDRDRPDAIEFFGTATSGPGTDSDSDGLSDAAEQRGWTVEIRRADGSTERREVTSDPFDPDSDADGIGDQDEKVYRTDPRDPDSDADDLTDERELNDIYSEPTQADSDGDGLPDGLEVDFFTTSPLYADTDGDQFTDDYEVTTDNRNPRIADLPVVEIEIGNVDLQLDVRFEEQSSRGTTTVDSKNVSTTLERSTSSRNEKVESSTLAGFFEAYGSGCYGGGCPSGGETIGNFGFSLTAGGGFSTSDTTTTTSESARASQSAYARSLTTEREASAETSITRIVEGASMAVAVSITNPGNVAYTVRDVEITALIQNGRDASSLTPVATLFAASDASISVGPLNPTRGPFRFVADDAFPQLIEQLMQNPRGIVFRVANYTLEDELGRRFAFVQQDVNDRTAGFEIDYAGNLDREVYQLATNAEFDAAGAPTGLSMAGMLEGVLGLEHVPEAEDVALDPTDRADADRIDASYSTRTVDGVEVLHRVRGVSRELTGEERDWWVITSDGLITPVGDNPGRDFRSVTVLAETNFVFKFVQDLDGDGIEKAVESTYGSVDSDLDTVADPDVPDSRDTDDDGIDDGVEPFGPFVGNGRLPWTIRFDDGRDAYQTSANPARADSDFDGLSDCQELRPTADGTPGGADLPCSLIDIYLDADGLPTLEVTGTFFVSLRLPARTDPADIDTDDDGLTDVQELLGFRYQGLDGQTLSVFPSAAGPAINPLSRDTDNDNLDDLQEIRLRTNPTLADGDSVRDNDGDGLVNLQETTARTISYAGPGGAVVSRSVTSDPGDPDSDDDGLTDWEEFYGCRDADRNLSCDSEARFGFTDPQDDDTDGDSLTDRAEVDAVDFPGDGGVRFTDPLDFDSDSDGRSDGAELLTPWTVTVTGRGGVRVYSDPLLADADGDDLDDSSEFGLGSNPNDPDTDGDGALDNLEATRVTDLLTPDHYVTVSYRGIQAGKGGQDANSDCDDGQNPGDFFFVYSVGIPTSGGLSIQTVTTSSSVPVRDCADGNDTGPCRNSDASNTWIQLAAPFKLSMNQPISFAVPFTDIFTVEGRVQELDPGGADLTYDFGGIGSADGVYDGASLAKGSFGIAFNDPPAAVGGKQCPVEVTVQVRVE